MIIMFSFICRYDARNWMKMSPWKLKTIMIIILFTAMFVFLLPFQQLSSQKCNCYENEIEVQPRLHEVLGRRDFIVYGDEDLNKTLQQIESFKLGSYAKNRRQVVAERQMKFRQKGWILDCITWDRKWETPPLEVDPHEFLFDVYHLGDGEDHDQRKNTFQQIFKKRDWPANDPSYPGLQSSGPGAMLKNAQGIISALNVIITKIKEHLDKSQITMLDLPCGDFQWMSKFIITRNDILYTGADIVPELIEHHRKEFGNYPRTAFIEWDIVKTPLNQSYDLILCRDLLQHLWKVDAMKALDHISSTKSGFLLMTTYPDTTENLEVEKDALGSRKFPYNLELPPFLLEPPICSSYDWNVEHLGLWSLPLRQKFDY